MMTATVTCLALAIYYEARSEPHEGQLAVAEVILNRVDSPHYPDNVCDVVWEKNQFSWTHDGKHDNPTRMSYLDRRAWERIKELSEDILDNPDILPGLSSTHYHSVAVSPFWKAHYEYDGKVGSHLFYTNETPHK